MTGTPEQAHAVATLMDGKGARYLDGAIERFPRDIGMDDALINVSGDEAMWFFFSLDVDPSAPEVALNYWFELLQAEARRAVAVVASDDFATTEATLSVHPAAVRQWRETALLSGRREGPMAAHMHNP